MFEPWNEPHADDNMPQKGELLENEAEIHFANGNLWQALSLQRQAMQIWEICGQRERQAQSAHIVGYLCFRLNDHDAALTAYMQALDLRAQLDDPLGMATTCARAAEVHQHRGNHQKAIDLLEVALSHWQDDEHRKEWGTVLNNIGVSCCALGQRIAARRYYERALAMRRAIDDRYGLAATLHNLGALCLNAGELQDARLYLDQAANIRRSLGAKAELGRTLLHLGLLHEQQQDLPQAITCYEQAWQIATDPDVNDPNDEAAALHNLGAAASASGDPDRALRLLEQAQGILTRTDKKYGLAMSYYHCGLTHRQMGNTEKAMECLSQTRALQEQIDDRSGLAATLVAMAVILSESGVHPPAYDMLVRASRLQNELSEHQAQLQTLNLLAHVCELQGKQEEARCYRRMAATNASPGLAM